MEELKIAESKQVWLTIGNTDNTEGRGFPVVLYVCDSWETAARLGKKKYVQGSDCPVEKAFAVKVGSRWLIPGKIYSETAEDAERRIAREKREAVIEKLKSAGLSEEEIAIISQ